jgi:hypothetical protein
MSKNLIPYDKTNSTNPYLKNRKEGLLIGPEGKELSAEYIWSKKGQERNDLVEWVFQYYRKNGFPKLQEKDEDLLDTYKKICEKDVSDILNAEGQVVNSNSTGSDILKHFMGELYYSTRGEGKNSISCIEAFNNDDKFRAVLRNRMGYNVSSEDGTIRPYIFSISDAMIIQGMRSSNIGFNTSTFKIQVCRYINKTYGKENGIVLDYSCGWGSRVIGSGSVGMKYIGIDPLTANRINTMIKFFNIDGFAVEGGSEEAETFKNIEKESVDLSWSSPPYFQIEKYSSDPTQCYNKYDTYSEWLSEYWNSTVSNCFNSLKKNAKFILCMVDKVGKHEIAKDMTDICAKYMQPAGIVPIKTSKGHLSGKKESGLVTKTTEAFYIFEKV